jgi:hypothetical protein
MNKCLVIAANIIYMVVVVSTGIISIVMSQIGRNQCDHKNFMGMDIRQYLLGGGIAIIGFNLLLFIGFLGLLSNDSESDSESTSRFLKKITMIMSNVTALFGIAWSIIGGLVIINLDPDCNDQDTSLFFYALSFYVFSPFCYGIVQGCTLDYESPYETYIKCVP